MRCVAVRCGAVRFVARLAGLSGLSGVSPQVTPYDFADLSTTRSHDRFVFLVDGKKRAALYGAGAAAHGAAAGAGAAAVAKAPSELDELKVGGCRRGGLRRQRVSERRGKGGEREGRRVGAWFASPSTALFCFCLFCSPSFARK